MIRHQRGDDAIYIYKKINKFGKLRTGWLMIFPKCLWLHQACFGSSFSNHSINVDQLSAEHLFNSHPRPSGKNNCHAMLSLLISLLCDCDWETNSALLLFLLQCVSWLFLCHWLPVVVGRKIQITSFQILPILSVSQKVTRGPNLFNIIFSRSTSIRL